MITYKEYKILVELKIKTLQAEVNKAINDGWKPIGGVDSNVLDGQVEYLQAMIYEREN